MTSRIFTGGTADWFTADSWNPAGTPQPGDTLSISAGLAQISAADVLANGTLNTETLLLGSTSSASPAGLAADGAAFGSGFAFTLAGFADLDLSGAVAFGGSLTAETAGGTLDIAISADATSAAAFTLGGALTIGDGDSVVINGGSFINDGVITVADGTLVVGSSTVLSGTGTINVGSGGVVVFDGAVPVGESINFTAGDGTIEVADPLAFDVSAVTNGTIVGTVTGFAKTDAIDLLGAPSYDWHYGTTSHIVTVLASSGSGNNPTVARFGLTGTTALTAQSIFIGQDGNGGSLIEAVDVRNWDGTVDGDWYSAGNWTTSNAASVNSYPLPGDTALIASGTAMISAADFTTYGALNNARVTLSGSAGLTIVEGTLGTDLTIDSASEAGTTTLTFLGTTVSDATINATGNASALQIAVGADGTIAGDFVNDVNATITTGSETELELVSGRITNNGEIDLNGAAGVGAGATVDGSGVLNFNRSDLTLNVAGSIGPQQQIALYQDTVKVLQGGTLDGIIENFVQGNTIDLEGIVANTASFDQTTNILTLSNSGTVVATLDVAGNYGTADFSLHSDGAGGTNITDTAPATTFTYTTTLPVSVILSAGGSISLAQLVTDAFGANFLTENPDIYISSPSQGGLDNFSYWDPDQPSLPYWTINGTALAADNLEPVTAAEASSVEYIAGNLIEAGATIEVPVAFSNGAPTSYIAYAIQTFVPSVAQPAVTTGAPTPAGVVAAAEAFNSLYAGVPNTEDCYNIAHEVAAAAGATLPEQTGSTTPSQNVAGGFWRIAYAAPQDASAVVNWGTLVQAGDIVRIGWNPSNSGHSFTVLAPETNGTITVFDNIAYQYPDGVGGSGVEEIGIHAAQYWSAADGTIDGTTNPEDITIYRLDPNDLFLIDDMTTDGTLIQNLSGAVVQGNTTNDLILPYGADNIINTDGGDNVIADTSAVLNGATIVGFAAGDTIDVTDIGSASIAYNAGTGLLDVTSGGTLVATLDLPTGLSGQFSVSALGGTAGLDAGLLGTLYTSLFPNVADGGVTLNYTACFATGTRIATTRGQVTVEELAVGDEAITESGDAAPIIWIGHRRLSGPIPEALWPVRITRGAIAPGLPDRDLVLSPEHALFIDGFLMPARALVNGATIRQEAASQITYWHVELASHDVILAEGVPAESYLDTGNRRTFANAGGNVLDLHPRFGRQVHEALACAPFVDSGPHLRRTRQALAARAEQLGHACVQGAWWIEADGEVLDQDEDGGWSVPEGARRVCLRSDAAPPMHTDPASTDTRRLGVCVAGIAIDGVAIALDDARLDQGLHAIEYAGAAPFRWTDGAATLPALGGRLTLAIGAAPAVWRLNAA